MQKHVTEESQLGATTGSLHSLNQSSHAHRRNRLHHLGLAQGDPYPQGLPSQSQ